MFSRTWFYTAAAVLAVMIILYGLTLAPGLTFIDSGELAAVCSTLGIAHPTGYPLYTLLGWLWVHLPLDVRPILMLNMLSALLACLALLIFYLCLSELFLRLPRPEHPLFQGPPPLAACLCLGCGTLLLGFSRVFWSVALVTEVYALHGFFICLLMYLVVKACAAACCSPEKPRLLSGPLFFTLGLSLCNHLSTVLIIPALLYLAVSLRDKGAPHARRLFRALLLMLAGLVPYLYLPLRAVQQPLLNWGDPRSGEAFFRHVSGRQYRVWMFASLETAVQQLEYFLQLVVESFGYLPVLLIPFGVWYLYRRSRPVCWFTLLFFLADVLYAVNYDIKDIDAYFLPAFVMCAVWMTAALLFFVSLAVRTTKLPARAALMLLGLCPLAPLLYNYAAVDQRTGSPVEQYTANILQGLESNALVLSYQWDYFCSPFYYLQLVEAVRPDVTMIEVKLLQRSWYLAQLESSFPALMAKSRSELERYRAELDAFEHGRPYDPAVIQQRYLELINSFIHRAIADRPVYVTCEQEAETGAGLQRVPEGLAFRLYPPENGYRRFDYGRLNLPAAAQFRPADRYHAALKSFYAFMLTSRVLYELRFGNRPSALALYEEARRIDPDYPLLRKASAALTPQRP